MLDTIIQRRPQIDPKTVPGRGKPRNFDRSMRLGPTVVFDTELSATKVRVLREATELK